MSTSETVPFGDAPDLRVPTQKSFTRTSLGGRILFGEGALYDLAHELDNARFRRAMLIVSSNQVVLTQRSREALGGRMALEWNEVRQHVPVELADRCGASAANADIDVLVAIGGGSTIGLGKAVAVRSALPLVVVPTTYSGSEMTPIYGLTTGREKQTARDNAALPQIVLYDPMLLTTLPASIVGTSGLNALAHCAEAIWSSSADPITDSLALEGAYRLQRYLPAAYGSTDVSARGQVLVAACLAGTALGTVGTSLHHALCHLLGGMLDAPHAETHAILLPYVIRYLQPGIPDAIERLADAMGSRPDRLAHDVWSLAQAVGTPPGLRAVGIKEGQIEMVTAAALDKGIASPRSLTHEALQALLHAAWSGEAPHPG
ncbi:maleylacetate reductase [Rhodococcus opacus]|uniref:maleylacetate reductase n=1 Tax=Rhodococcus opacus TaxID=37919 RepID=UPI002952FD45|nr:maleylacetate reductase [Rhodococcus opacus]MDV7089117.1 maleylacetate reductase [Rhodococcus opacus]